MVWPFRKKRDVIDLTKYEKYRKKEIPVEEREPINSENLSSDSTSGLGFLGSMAEAAENNSESTYGKTDSFSQEQKRAKLREVLNEIRERIDSLSTKIYKLTDRLEAIEKRLDRIDRRETL